MDILHPDSTSDSRFNSHRTVIKARKGTRVQYFYCILRDVLEFLPNVPFLFQYLLPGPSLLLVVSQTLPVFNSS